MGIQAFKNRRKMGKCRGEFGGRICREKIGLLANNQYIRPIKSLKYAMKKLTGIAVCSLAIAFAGCVKREKEIQLQNTSVTDVTIAPQQVGTFVQNEVLLKFSEGMPEINRGQILGRIQGQVREHILTAAMKEAGDLEGLYLVYTPMEVKAAIEAIQGAGVQYAEPNYLYFFNATANDPYYINSSLWGMYGDASSPANQYGSQAAEQWAAGNTGSSSVHVGIIDEGVMHNHEDLAANIWTNPYETLDGVDNDGNGYKDDIHGWDFAANNSSTFDGADDDHGTHVAGTIGAVGNNDKGVAGVNWAVTIITAKFLGRNGGTTANAVKALDYMSDLKNRHGLNIVATNNSWGGGGYSQSLKDAIDRSNTRDILFIAAAGNSTSNNDVTASYPSNYSSANVIAVASTTSGGGLSSFSNYGATQVDLGAPGSGIWSSVPKKIGKSVTSGYASYSGTSMATPHVTGAAALYAAMYPGSTAATIKNAILSKVIATTSLNGKTATGGRLDVSGF